MPCTCSVSAIFLSAKLAFTSVLSRVTTGLRDKAIAEKLEVQGIVPRIMSPAQYRDFVTSEAEKFGKIVAQANIKAEN